MVPLTIRFGSEELVDGRDLTTAQFWTRLSAARSLPETAAPSPGQFEQAFRDLAIAGCSGIVCVCLSAALSATYQSAKAAATAASDAVHVEVIDSRSATLGEGMIALAAAQAARAGADLATAAQVASDATERIRVFGALDTLDALHKGGRIGGAAAFLGSLLSIKPVIEVRSGVVEPESRQRTRARSLGYLVEKVRQHAPVERLAVLHGDAADLDQFLDMIGDVFPRNEVIVGAIGPVIGTHAGPGAIGVAFEVPASATT